jgi:hypothetical protein
MKRRLMVITIVITLAFLMIVPAAQAIPTLYLTDGSNSVTIEDQAIGDSNPIAGAVTYIGSLGVWDLNVGTGVTKPFSGSSTNPHMDLNSVDSSTGAGELQIWFYENGFDFTGNLVNAVGGTTAGSVEFVSAVNLSPIIADLGPFGPGAFSGTISGTATLSSTDYLLLFADIQHDGAGLTSFNYEVKVPEPGMLVLLGSGLVGIAFFGRKRVKR